MKYEDVAKEFCNMIVQLDGNAEALHRLECYLSYHFETWMNRYANTPENLVCGLRLFVQGNEDYWNTPLGKD